MTTGVVAGDLGAAPLNFDVVVGPYYVLLRGVDGAGRRLNGRRAPAAVAARHHRDGRCCGGGDREPPRQPPGRPPRRRDLRGAAEHVPGRPGGAAPTRSRRSPRSATLSESGYEATDRPRFWRLHPVRARRRAGRGAAPGRARAARRACRHRARAAGHGRSPGAELPCTALPRRRAGALAASRGNLPQKAQVDWIPLAELQDLPAFPGRLFGVTVLPWPES